VATAAEDRLNFQQRTVVCGSQILRFIVQPPEAFSLLVLRPFAVDREVFRT